MKHCIMKNMLEMSIADFLHATNALDECDTCLLRNVCMTNAMDVCDTCDVHEICD